jgi:glycosyltransferase involved in cell wall biosynthesis
MRILLIGEYSRLHNSLKEGLLELGHEVKIVANSDGFKNFPVDYSIDYKFCKLKTVNFFRQAIVRVFGFDIAKLEQGIRFYLLLKKFKDYDVVQFINETSINTTKKMELFLIKKILSQNKKAFFLTTGIDVFNLQYWLSNPNKKSIIQPYIQNNKIYAEYDYIKDYLSKKHIKNHDFIIKNCYGIIATDLDYVAPNIENPKFLGMIPNPVNLKKLNYNELLIKDKINIFLGINEWSYNQKGIIYFEKALAIIQKKYPKKVTVIVAKTLPYFQYIEAYNKTHILLDQALAIDQGYNALEAMAKGKVVFTGAESEFTDYYKITERVCINAKPNVAYLVNELSFLIENPNEIIAIGKRARAFVEKEHDYVKTASTYLKVWEEN